MAPRFTEFVKRLGVQLTPGQMILARVAFDGEEPANVPGADVLFGAIAAVPAAARTLIVIVCGGRAGKTYLCALYLLYLALFVPLNLAPGEEASAPFVAPDLERARQGLRYAAGACRESAHLRKLIVRDTTDALTIRRPDGNRVTLQAIAASRGGITGRGKSLVGAVMDEAAFFRDRDSGVVNDAEIFKAIGPRVVEGGKLLVPSTPWLESGILHDYYTSDYGRPRNALVAHAPTAVLNPAPHILQQIQRERERDPENAKREFDAQFVSGGMSTYFDPKVLSESSTDLVLGRDADPLADVAACLDAGFRRDSSALVIVERVGGVVSVLDVITISPEPGKPLKPSEVCATFGERLEHYGITRVAADSFYVESVREHLQPFGVDVDELPAGQGGKADVYAGARTVLHESRLRLPRHAGLLRDMRGIVSRAMPGGGMSISSPRSATGGHGDIASALVGAIWQLGPANVGSAPPPPAPLPDTEAWILAERDRNRQRVLDEQQDNGWF